MQHHSSIPLKAKIALFATIFFWASAFVGIRAGLESYSPGGLGLLRFLIASSCMLFIYSRRSERSQIAGRDLLTIFLAGAFGIGFYNIALNYGEVMVPSGIASFIVSQSPIVSTLLAVFFLNERVGKLGVVGMAISVLGVTLITFGQGGELKFYIDIFYIITATVVGSVYSILLKPLLKKYHAIDLAAYAIWSGTFILLFFTPNLIQDVSQASLSATLSVIYLGIFPGALAYIGWGYVLKEIPASRAVSFLYFSPVISTFIGWIWLSEVPAILSLIGGLIALFGVWVVGRSYRYKVEKIIAQPEAA